MTAASGAAAAAGGFLTERGKTDTLVLTTGTKADPGDRSNWLQMLKNQCRVVVYMGVGAAADIETDLRKEGIASQVTVQIIANAQQPDQQIETCQGDGLVDCLRDANIKNRAILSFAMGDDVERVMIPGQIQPMAMAVA